MSLIYKTINHASGHIEKIWFDDAVIQPTVVKWSTFESLLDDVVISELAAIRDRTTATNKNTRRAVIELINDMNSDKTFDAFGDEITSLLTKMVATNLITLDQATANSILTELQNS